MALLTVNTTFNIDLQFETSPIHYRLFAWFIDFFLLIVFWTLMSKLLNSAFSIEHANAFGLTEIFLITPFLLYHVLFEVFCNGQSPGKMIFKIQVIS
ncbi:MAG: RDD family protein, partial [Bacteroidetes bacterium]|nr:RDD family protein [Bacteroidota bacterium]